MTTTPYIPTATDRAAQAEMERDLQKIDPSIYIPIITGLLAPLLAPMQKKGHALIVRVLNWLIAKAIRLAPTLAAHEAELRAGVTAEAKAEFEEWAKDPNPIVKLLIVIFKPIILPNVA